MKISNKINKQFFNGPLVQSPPNRLKGIDSFIRKENIKRLCADMRRAVDEAKKDTKDA